VGAIAISDILPVHLVEGSVDGDGFPFLLCKKQEILTSKTKKANSSAQTTLHFLT